MPDAKRACFFGVFGATVFEVLEFKIKRPVGAGRGDDYPAVENGISAELRRFRGGSR